MIKWLNTFFIIFFSAAFSSLFSGAELYPEFFLTPNEILLVKKGEILTSVTLRNKGNTLTSGVENILPVTGTYMPSSKDFDMIAVQKGFFYMENSGANRLKIYRAATDFAGLSGMIYYSKTDGIFSKLVLYSYRILTSDSYIRAGSGKDGVPEEVVSHFTIRDNRLGSITFRSKTVSAGDSFVISNVSTGKVTKLGMDIFYPGDYRIYKFLIYDSNAKGYFFYTAQFMKVRSNILGKLNLIGPESFGNRIRAEDIHFMKSIGIDRMNKLAAFR